jgi:formylmethanofuran dehydrogenase subunit E
MIRTLDEILCESASRHRHLCPRQVLGARMGLYAGELLGLDLPRGDKRLLAISETDGCAVDGLIAATGCRVGSRTLRILDFGKVAATFIDTHTEQAVRLAPNPLARSLAPEYAPVARNDWMAMLVGYQRMPVEKLLCFKQVHLNLSLKDVVSKPGRKSRCELCGEEIINGRELVREDSVLCRSCAGERYYQILELSNTVENLQGA